MPHDGRSRKLPFDPEEALAHLRARDPKLGALIERAGPFNMKLDALPSPFESLLESILYQQLHGKAAATIHRRLLESFGPTLPPNSSPILATRESFIPDSSRRVLSLVPSRYSITRSASGGER